MHDMFIQSQQLVTNSSSGVVQSKKRKAEHYISEQFLPQDSTYAVNNSNQTELNNASPNNQQPFVRASTIKLLDTYQRCGQKRKAWSPEGNGDSGETNINTESTNAATTTAHSKVAAAPGANPQPQGKKRKEFVVFFLFHVYCVMFYVV